MLKYEESWNRCSQLTSDPILLLIVMWMSECAFMKYLVFKNPEPIIVSVSCEVIGTLQQELRRRPETTGRADPLWVLILRGHKIFRGTKTLSHNITIITA